VGGQGDLELSIKAIMAARREELGGPPTPEELLAYRDDRLSPEQRRKVEAQIAVYPDAARALADLRAFPAVEPAPGTPELSGEEIDAGWQAFHQRLLDLPAPEIQGRAHPGGAAPAPVAARPPGIPGLSGLPGIRGWPAMRRLTAAALVALGAGWTAGYLTARAARDRQAAAINVKIAELAPAEEGRLRSAVAAAAVEMPAGAEELLLVLGEPRAVETAAAAGAGYSDYQAEIVDAAGKPAWSLPGLRPTPLGTFQLSFRRGALAPGHYVIRLFGSDRRRRTLLTTYDLRLLAAADAR
jgi:anti-sigma factor RsiW